MKGIQLHFQLHFELLFLSIFLSCGLYSQDLMNVRQLTSDDSREGFPTWSPKGDSIIYQCSVRDDTTGKNGLWKISLDGTGKRQIFSGIAEHPRWSPDGKYVVFDADTGQTIKMIPASGGDLVTFLSDTIQIDKGGLPCWSPDAKQIAFKDADSYLCVHKFITKKTTRIFKKEGMIPIPGCWSNDGKSILIALMDMETKKSTIWEISSDGKEKKQIKGHHENLYRYLELSPDGSILVYVALEGNLFGLYVMSSEGGKSLPLAISPQGHNDAPNWSPDGKRIAFSGTRSWNVDIWLMDVDADQIKQELDVPEKQ